MAEQFYQRDIYGQALVELGKVNKDIVVLDADLSGSTRTVLFSKEFPEKFFKWGVCKKEKDGICRRPCQLLKNSFCFNICDIRHRPRLGSGEKFGQLQ